MAKFTREQLESVVARFQEGKLSTQSVPLLLVEIPDWFLPSIAVRANYCPESATYHRFQDFRAYLNDLNQGLTEEEWRMTCLRFAPNAPEQNPVEDIWLQVKIWVRQFYHLCSSFQVVKYLFEFFANGQVFDFPKVYDYAVFT